MKIKSYFARTVESAMATAREELGDEAMLVNTRRAPAEARHLGEYEVVFAVDAPASGSVTDSRTASTPAPAATDQLSIEVSNLKRELEGMRKAITRTAMSPAQWLGAPPDLSDGYAVLTQNDVAPELAREIVQGANGRLQRTRIPFQQALIEEIGSRLTVDPSLGRGEIRPRITALVGPPGSGKTTTLVKLAVNYGLKSRRPVLLLSTDTYRIAAAEQLRSYASILGVGFQVTDTVSALAQTLEENRGKDLILIDTSGFGLSEMDNAGPLAHFLSTRKDIDTQLVMPASMKPSDITRIADAYDIFAPQRLVFTKLDETGSYGAILSEAARTGKPLSFFTSGQTIPEDLETASRERVVELVLGAQARTAARRSAAA